MGCEESSDEKMFTAISTLPSFNIISLDSTKIIKSTDLGSGKSLIFFFFSPGCEHCQKEAEQLVKMGNTSSDITIFLITEESLQEARAFTKFYGLNKLKNVLVGKDYQYSFFKIFLPQSIPFIVVYGRNKQIKKIFLGETDLRLIESTLNE